MAAWNGSAPMSLLTLYRQIQKEAETCDMQISAFQPASIVMDLCRLAIKVRKTCSQLPVSLFFVFDQL